MLRKKCKNSRSNTGTAPLDEAEPKTIVILDSEVKLSKRQRFCIKCESKFDDNKHKIPWLYVAWEEDDSDTREGDLRTGKAYLAKMIPDRDVKGEEDLEESDGDSSHEKDLEESDGDSSHEEDLEESDDDVCTNVKSFYPADSIVCDSRMVSKVTLYVARSLFHLDNRTSTHSHPTGLALKNMKKGHTAAVNRSQRVIMESVF